jgi:hypothetical protein
MRRRDGAEAVSRNPLRDIIGKCAALRAQLRALPGHSLARSIAAAFAGRALRQSVLLRNPGGWHVGVCKYRLWCAQRRAQPAPPPIEVLLRARRRNPIARFLLMRCFEVGYPGLYALSSRDRFLRLKTALEGFH